MNLLTTAVAVLLISLAMCNSQALANCDTSSLSANDLTWSAGTVNSHQDAIISTEIPGVITWISEPGQELKKGDVILRLEDTQYRIAVKESQTKLKLLEMKIDYLEKKYQASSSLLGSASISEMYVDDLKFDLDSARADQQLEKLALQKNNSLLEKGESPLTVCRRHCRAHSKRRTVSCDRRFDTQNC